MFDIGWSELLIIGIVTLLFVGPKDLPVFLRTLGRYLGVIKKQANEFRAQFDEALRETELDQLRKDVVGMKNEVEKSVRDVGRQVEDDFSEVRRDVESATKPQLDKPKGTAEAAAGKTGIGTGLDPSTEPASTTTNEPAGKPATGEPSSEPASHLGSQSASEPASKSAGASASSTAGTEPSPASAKAGA